MINDKILEYLINNKTEDLIGISRLIDFCKISMWDAYNAAKALEYEGKIKIVKHRICANGDAYTDCTHDDVIILIYLKLNQNT